MLIAVDAFKPLALDYAQNAIVLAIAMPDHRWQSCWQYQTIAGNHAGNTRPSQTIVGKQDDSAPKSYLNIMQKYKFPKRRHPDTTIANIVKREGEREREREKEKNRNQKYLGQKGHKSLCNC